MVNKFKKRILILSFGAVIISAIYIKINKNVFKEEVNTSNNITIGEESEVLLSNLDNNDSLNNNRNVTDEEIKILEEIIKDPFFILVNKDNRISKDYVPDNLKLSKVKFLDYIETRYLDSATANALKDMFEGAVANGITLLGASGYRSYDIQKILYDSRVSSLGKERTSLYTAEPGASEHQTGLAVDIVSSDYQNLDEGFENSKGFEWLINNCYKYGFILRYLKGKEEITGYNYEPWHFRYIGNVEIAEEIMKRGITFEEYIKEVKDRIQELTSNK